MWLSLCLSWWLLALVTSGPGEERHELTLSDFLEELNMGEIIPMFEEEEVDLDILKTMTKNAASGTLPVLRTELG